MLCSIFMSECGLWRSSSNTAKSRMGRRLFVLLCAEIHLKELQGLSCTPAHSSFLHPKLVPGFPAKWWPSIVSFHSDLPLCLPFGPPDKSGCSPFYKKLLPTVCVSSDLCRCPKLLFFPSPSNCASPQEEMPAPNTPHATTGLETCLCGCLFGDMLNLSCGANCRALLSSLQGIKSQCRFLYMHNLELQLNK